MPHSSIEGKALPPSRRTPYLFLGLVAVLAAAIILVTWRFHVAQEEAFVAEEQQQLQSVADGRVRQLQEWRDVRMGEARAIMADRPSMTVAERLVRGRASATDKEAVEGLMEAIRREFRYDAVGLVDTQGRVVGWVGRRFGGDDHVKLIVDEVLSADSIVERDFHVDPKGGASHIGINLPLRLSDGAAPFGVLVLAIDPVSYLHLAGAATGISRTGEVILARPDGDSVLMLGDLRGLPNAALHLRVPLSRTDVACVMAANGRQGFVHAKDYRGVSVLAVLKKVPDTTWFLVAKVDADEVWEPIRRRSLLLGLVATSMILAAAAVVFVFWRREQEAFQRARYEAEIRHEALAGRYDLLSRYANDIILLLDEEGRIVRANDRALEAYGYGREELEGMGAWELRPPERRDEFHAQWELTKTRDSLVFECEHQSRTGRLFPVEISGRGLNVGGRKFRQAIIRDVSDRKQAERELAESEARFRKVVEHAPDGIMLTGPDLEILYANPEAARLFGAANELAILGESLLSRVPPEEREALRAQGEAIAAGIQAPLAERRYQRLDDAGVWVEVSGTPIEYDGGTGSLLFFRDITERKRRDEEHAQLEEQLRQSQKMESIGQLAGGVAHDFNNYLTVINGYCDMLLATGGDPGQLHEGLEEIRAAGERAAGLTQQLLAFSRKQIVEPRLVNLNHTVSDAGRMLGRLIGEHIAIITRLDEDLGAVMADPGQMGQVLMNLAINARDAMPGGGKLVIETRECCLEDASAPVANAQAGRYIVLAVTDTGAGMSPETLARIFEPFYTTKGRGVGTGLGLSTSYGIVRQAGGWIAVRSEPGKGSRFEVWLPRSEAECVETSAPAEAEMDGRGQETVLLVEDQVEVRRLAMTILKRNGYRLLEAENGANALEISARFPGHIDMLLTDVVMPGMTGRELAGQLLARRPGTKVLYMSGYSGDVIAQQGFLDSDVQYLPKPFTPVALSQKVREVLGAGGTAGTVATVLVIDDEEPVRVLLARVLDGAGYRVVAAADGHDGMRAIEAGAVDLVITDLVMPGQEGLETLRLLSASRPDLPVIAMSGAFEGTFLKAAGLFGARATLLKPIEPETLLREVQRVLSERAVADSVHSLE